MQDTLEIEFRPHIKTSSIRDEHRERSFVNQKHVEDFPERSSFDLSVFYEANVSRDSRGLLLRRCVALHCVFLLTFWPLISQHRLSSSLSHHQLQNQMSNSSSLSFQYQTSVPTISYFADTLSSWISVDRHYWWIHRHAARSAVYVWIEARIWYSHVYTAFVLPALTSGLVSTVSVLFVVIFTRIRNAWRRINGRWVSEWVWRCFSNVPIIWIYLYRTKRVCVPISQNYNAASTVVAGFAGKWYL